MRLFVLVLISVALLQREASAGPIWDRARRMFGWDRAGEHGQNVALHAGPHSYGGSPDYPANGPPQRPAGYGPSGSVGAYPAPAGYNKPSLPRPDVLQHASSGLYGSYLPPSYAGPSYGKAPYVNYPSAASSYGPYAQGDYGAPSASNNYGGLFSVVDQTSQIGQLANGDLTAAPSEPYISGNEEVVKSLMKMMSKPFDLEAAASGGSPYYQQSAHLAFNPGPRPIMEADRNVIYYRTSPIQIGVADASYNQRHFVGHVAGSPGSLGHGFDAAAYATSALASGGLASPYGGDIHAAASSMKKSLISRTAQKQ